MTKNNSRSIGHPLSKRIRIDYDSKSSVLKQELREGSPYDTDESSSTASLNVRKRVKRRKKKKSGEWFTKVTPHVTSAELPMELFNDEEDLEEQSGDNEEEDQEEEETDEDSEEEEDAEKPSIVKEELLSNGEERLNEETSTMEIKKEPEDESKLPSAVETSISITDTSIVPISEYEEERILKHLESSPALLSKNLFARQLRRKLKVRQLQREKGLPLFDLDATVTRIAKENNLFMDSATKEEVASKDSVRVLDRFLAHPNIHFTSHSFSSFKMKLVGRDEYSEFITSPYTGRTLKPYIRRDYESRPLKLKLLDEILARGKNVSDSYPIDYCYVQPHHIPAVNNLAEKFFWPGIDLSECLQYPDFSCVVLYRRIVIAFAFMVPDVSHTEAYISFVFTHPEWRRAGIGKFMLYHLIQTCMGKDIILHVSANNPAILLYQKFGFKVDEYIVDFYDKYLPPNSNECKHALLLRLSRY